MSVLSTSGLHTLYWDNLLILLRTDLGEHGDTKDQGNYLGTINMFTNYIAYQLHSCINN